VPYSNPGGEAKKEGDFSVVTVHNKGKKRSIYGNISAK
jgi:hypothetical protein